MTADAGREDAIRMPARVPAARGAWASALAVLVLLLGVGILALRSLQPDALLLLPAFLALLHRSWWLPSLAASACTLVLLLEGTAGSSDPSRLLLGATLWGAVLGALIRDLVTRPRRRSCRGLVPICASCKDVREASGAWRPVEVSLRTQGLAEFTHGLCPGCAGRFLGQMELAPRPEGRR